MSRIDLTALAEQTEIVAELRVRLAKIKADLASVRSLCGHTGYDVTVAGVRVGVAAMDPQTCMAKMIRGREMIHLGAIKALDAMVDAYAERLASEEAKLSRIAAETEEPK